MLEKLVIALSGSSSSSSNVEIDPSFDVSIIEYLQSIVETTIQERDINIQHHINKDATPLQSVVGEQLLLHELVSNDDEMIHVCSALLDTLYQQGRLKQPLKQMINHVQTTPKTETNTNINTETSTETTTTTTTTTSTSRSHPKYDDSDSDNDADDEKIDNPPATATAAASSGAASSTSTSTSTSTSPSPSTSTSTSKKLCNEKQDIENKEKSLLSNMLEEEEGEFTPIHPADLRLMARGDVRDVHMWNVTVSIKGKELLSSAQLLLKEGHRYGLVGVNGIGKSTLLRRLSQRRIAGFPSHIQIVHVQQHLDADDRTALQTVLDADWERSKLMKREKQIQDIIKQMGIHGQEQEQEQEQEQGQQGQGQAEREHKEKKEQHTEPASSHTSNPSDPTTSDASVSDSVDDVSSLHDEFHTIRTRLHDIDAHSAPTRATSLLLEMGITELDCHRPTAELSGGQRMRVALAAALMLEPDILCLDEPTSHLDLRGIIWLQRWLQESSCTILVVSHDRTFLNTVTTDTIHFHHQQLHYYPTNYEGFLKTISEKRDHLARMQAALDGKREHIKASIEKVKQQARKKGHGEMKMGMVASRQKKLGRMGFEKTADGKKFVAQLHGRRQGAQWDTDGGYTDGAAAASQLDVPERELRIQFIDPDLHSVCAHLDDTLMHINDISFAWGNDRPLFQHVNLILRAGMRVGLLGLNGTGKSTLLRILARDLEPTSGSIDTRPHVRVAYLPQYRSSALNMEHTPIQHLLSQHVATNEHDARGKLSRFGITGYLATKPCGTLSGGQQVRVVLSCACALEPHILICDEPSNHLDEPSVRSLITAFKAFKGAIIITSHDQAVLSEACDRLYMLERISNKITTGPLCRFKRLEGTFHDYVQNLR